ncbi:hypothetical protein KR222_006435, partial [Zaprionus bogoriensis]
AGAAAAGSGNKDASSGRLFLKKFLMFKNMFSSNNQPVIPIIITGAGTGTATSSPTSPTVTVTSTGTIPSATGTVTTSPTTPSSTTTTGRNYSAQQDEEQADDDQAEQEELQLQQEHEPAAIAMAASAELIDEQALQSAIAAGAQEYEVFTDGDQVDQSKATQSNRINLRRKGGRRGQGQGQVISVRIPPRYRRYFKNGQKVMLNTKSRPNKRRVVRKRIQGGSNGNKNNKNKRFNNRRRGQQNKNKNKKNKNKNKRTRIPVV